MTLRNPVAVGEDTRVSGRMCFNTAFLFLLLLACWLMVSLFWLRITTALLVHLLACLTTWSILGCCTSFYLHQSWQVCSIMFLLVVSHFYTIYTDGHAWNYSWFQLHRELLERFPRRAKEFRSVWDHLDKWDIYMSMGLGRMHLRLLEGLANIIAEAHCNILDRSWSSGEVPADWKRANITPIYKKEKKKRDLGNYRWVNLTWVPWKILEWALLEAISRHEEEEGNWEKPTHTSANSALSHCQQFVICFIINSIETWKHDLPHEDLGKEGIKEALQVSLCHL